MSSGHMDLSMFAIPRDVTELVLLSTALPYFHPDTGDVDQAAMKSALDLMLGEAATTARSIVLQEGGSQDDVEAAVWVIIHSIQAALLPLQ